MREGAGTWAPQSFRAERCQEIGDLQWEDPVALQHLLRWGQGASSLSSLTSPLDSGWAPLAEPSWRLEDEGAAGWPGSGHTPSALWRAEDEWACRANGTCPAQLPSSFQKFLEQGKGELLFWKVPCFLSPVLAFSWPSTTTSTLAWAC